MVLLGKTLQFTALVLLPASMFLELNDTLGRQIGVADMLVMLLLGILMFVSGRLFEGYGRQPR